MADNNTACLDTATWIESLVRLSDRTGGDAPIENCLRLSRHLCVLAPPPFDGIVACRIDEAAFEELLAQEAFEAAAAALIGPPLSHEIVSQSASTASARVWCEGQPGEALAHAPTAARALVLAWAGFLLSLRPGRDVQATGNSHRSA